MFRFSCSAAARTQPWQSRQIGGQLSGLATHEIQEVKLNWLTREATGPFRQSPAPPFNELEVPAAAALGSEKADHIPRTGRGEENKVICRCPWCFEWQRIQGEVGFQCERTSLGCRTQVQMSRTTLRDLNKARGREYWTYIFQLATNTTLHECRWTSRKAVVR